MNIHVQQLLTYATVHQLMQSNIYVYAVYASDVSWFMIHTNTLTNNIADKIRVCIQLTYSISSIFKSKHTGY